MIRFSTTILCVLFGVAAVLLTNCKNNANEATPAPPSSQQLTAYSNVVVVDSSKYSLDLTPALLASGTYRFTASGTVLNLPVGTILVGEQGHGFLRRVTATTASGQQTTVQTQPASLDEAFSSGKLTLRASSDSLQAARTTGAAFEYTFGNQPLYQSGPLSLTLRSGSITLNPDWVIEAGFGPQGTIEAKVATQNASLSGNFVFNVNAAQAATLVAQSSNLKRYKKDFTIRVPVVIAGLPVRIPVVVRMTMDLNLEYSATVSAAIQRDVTFSTTTTFDVGAAYANNQWQGIYDINPTNKLTLGPRSGQAKVNVQMAVIPKISFQLYRAVGPYASVGLQEELQGAVASPALDWDFRADAWLRTTIGVTGKVLGKQLPDYATSWDTKKLTYQSPVTLERTSGDNQTGSVNKALPLPIKVRVLDSNGNPESGVPVYFTTTTGNGSASPSSILTDANGYAQTTWTLGTITTALQQLKATAKKADGTPITGAPLDFAAVVGCSEDPTKLALLTGGSSKRWKRTTVNGQPNQPLCPGTFDTLTFSTSHELTSIYWYENPAKACVSGTTTVPYALCGQDIGQYDNGQFKALGTITSLTSSQLVVQENNAGVLTEFGYIPD